MKILHTLRSFFKGYVFFIFLFLANGDVCSQAYHYFDIDINQGNNEFINLHIFLTVSSDGTGSTRVRYFNPTDGEQRLVVQNVKDTTLQVSYSDSLARYLTNIGSNIFLEGMEDSSLAKTRIKFIRKSENNEVFYEPKGIDYLDKSETWQRASLKNHIIYSYDDLKLKKEFLRIFYQANDPIFEYLSIIGSRGESEFTATELASKMYLIAVANTLDEKIGSSSKKDLDKINALFSKLAGKMGIPFTSYIISGTDFSINNVSKRIRKLRPNSSDIIVFYYSGHGFRYDEDTNKFPRMSLRTDPNSQPLNKNNLQVSEVSDLLKNKEAHVTIVISDCCNENIGSAPPTGVDVLRPRGSLSTEKLNIEVCKKLFFPAKPVSIVAGSAEIGQLAAGNPSLGGFFTNFFDSNLTTSLYGMNGASSWIKILSDAREKTRRQALTALCGDKRCIQRAELSVVPPL